MLAHFVFCARQWVSTVRMGEFFPKYVSRPAVRAPAGASQELQWRRKACSDTTQSQQGSIRRSRIVRHPSDALPEPRVFRSSISSLDDRAEDRTTGLGEAFSERGVVVWVGCPSVASSVEVTRGDQAGGASVSACSHWNAKQGHTGCPGGRSPSLPPHTHRRTHATGGAQFEHRRLSVQMQHERAQGWRSGARRCRWSSGLWPSHLGQVAGAARSHVAWSQLVGVWDTLWAARARNLS